MRRIDKRDNGSDSSDRQSSGHTWEVIKALVAGETDASRLLELYYWTREPGIVELIRAYLDLPERTQRGLGNYLLNSRPQSIMSSFDAQGRLLLSKSELPSQAEAEKQRQSSRS